MRDVTELERSQLKANLKQMISQTPTPRQVQSTMLESITTNKSHYKDPKLMEIKRYPTPTKKIKSISMLKKRINQFFDCDYIPNTPDDLKNNRKTINDLATWLGYASKNTLMLAIQNNSVPEYSEWLEYAVCKLENDIETAWLTRIESAPKNAKAFEQYDKFLARMDNVRARYAAKEDKKDLNISINIAKVERIDEAIYKSVSNLQETVNKSIANAQDADIEENKEDLTSLISSLVDVKE